MNNKTNWIATIIGVVLSHMLVKFVTRKQREKTAEEILKMQLEHQAIFNDWVKDAEKELREKRSNSELNS